MADIESEFVRHLPCEHCGSSDANSLYSDGHTHCFACNHHTRSSDDEPMTSFTNVQLQGVATSLPKRNISQQICELYKIYLDGESLRFHYFDEGGRVIGVKTKTKDKQFRYEGATDGRFFGQNLYPSHGKTIVIFEGELDAASGSEAMPKWPIVSLPSGAAAAKRSIQRNLEFLQGYEKIGLFFDNDDAGQQALQDAASVLPPGKTFVAHLPTYKDASEALQDNDFESVRQAIYKANPYQPDGIVDAKTLYESVTNHTENCLHEYPFKGLQDKTHGIKLGTLTTVVAGTGIGKSSFCRQLCAHLLNKGERCGYLGLEESVRQTTLGLMSVDQEKAFHIGTHDRKELAKAFDDSIGRWNLFLYDGFGSVDPDVIYNRVEYLATGLDCRVIFVDHLSILISGLDGDERRMIDKTMTRLRSLVERTQVAMFLVSHLRRTQTDQNHEEGAKVNIGQLRGSAAIAQLSDMVIALERNQQSDSAGNATTLRVLKNRYSGETGTVGTLEYDLNKCKFYETNASDYFSKETESPDF